VLPKPTAIPTERALATPLKAVKFRLGRAASRVGTHGADSGIARFQRGADRDE
jgi:hypothetical protein